MKPKKLLIVTSYYPYGHGESFVKAELELISAYFEAVEIVPCFHLKEAHQPKLGQSVNLAYADSRWGLLRSCKVAASLAVALFRYEWAGDAQRILGGDHKYVNAVELVRALYRARLFEKFLEQQINQDGKEVSLVYFYWMIPEILGAAEFRKHAKLPFKIVCRAHRGDLYEDLRPGGYAGLRDGIVSGVDEIYCISDHGKSYLANRYPMHAKKIHTARLGVNDPGYLNPQPRDGQLSIVSCSFVIAEKRVHLIADAIAFLLQKAPALKIKWTHIGDGALFDQLRDYVKATLGARAEVVFTGYLAQPQVMNLYREREFDVFINVSDSEGLPVSLMEASSTGIPIVATDVGGSGEIVNARNGVLLPANPDVAVIASALVMFKNREMAASYRQQARADWGQRFHASVNYHYFGQQLLQLMEWQPDAA
jgi:colanic acid/amylovoran biosynthesis glycosyltransferase